MAFQIEALRVPGVEEKALENIKINAARGLPQVPLHDYSLRRINVCGNGPSLKEIWPDNHHSEVVASLNGAWRALQENGVSSDYIIAYDPSPENVAWFKNAPKDTKYILGSRMDPAVFDLLQDHQVYIWHLLSDNERALKLSPLFGGGHTVGSAALNLLAGMGYNYFHLYGYDSCWSGNEHHAAPQEWAVEPPRPYSTNDGQTFMASPWMVGQVEQMLAQVLENTPDYTVKVHDKGMLAASLETNTLNVVYDLNVAPGSFDFMHSLFNVRHYMHENRWSKARVHFKAGSEKGFRPNELIQMSHAGKQRMLNKVVRPMLEMHGMEECEIPEHNRMEFSYSPAESLARYRATHHMPRFQPSREAMLWALENYSDGPIVITLRECTYWPQRNSDTFEWIKFARYIGDSKRVIFLRDTDCVGQPFEFETCDEASLDLHKRMALYRRASMCFFVMNGPASLAYYTQYIPYGVFLTSAPGYPCYSPEFLQRFIGIDPYGQFPWTNLKRQRLVYGDDDFEAIKKVYHGLTK